MQLTIHSIIEAGEKVIAHVCSPNAQIDVTRAHVVLTLQFSLEAKTSIGVDLDREQIQIVTFVTDDDGILKMKDVEAFIDSKGHLDFVKAVVEAKANRQQHVA